jgi:hypothetical protein
MTSKNFKQIYEISSKCGKGEKSRKSVEMLILYVFRCFFKVNFSIKNRVPESVI